MPDPGSFSARQLRLEVSTHRGRESSPVMPAELVQEEEPPLARPEIHRLRDSNPVVPLLDDLKELAFHPSRTPRDDREPAGALLPPHLVEHLVEDVLGELLLPL